VDFKCEGMSDREEKHRGKEVTAKEGELTKSLSVEGGQRLIPSRTQAEGWRGKKKKGTVNSSTGYSSSISVQITDGYEGGGFGGNEQRESGNHM